MLKSYNINIIKGVKFNTSSEYLFTNNDINGPLISEVYFNNMYIYSDLYSTPKAVDHFSFIKMLGSSLLMKNNYLKSSQYASKNKNFIPIIISKNKLNFNRTLSYIFNSQPSLKNTSFLYHIDKKYVCPSFENTFEIGTEIIIKRPNQNKLLNGDEIKTIFSHDKIYYDISDNPTSKYGDVLGYYRLNDNNIIYVTKNKNLVMNNNDSIVIDDFIINSENKYSFIDDNFITCKINYFDDNYITMINTIIEQNEFVYY